MTENEKRIYDRFWRKLLAFDDAVKRLELLEYSKRKGMYRKAMIQVNKIVKGKIGIHEAMTDPDSPLRNSYKLMWLDMQECWRQEKINKFKEEYGL